MQLIQSRYISCNPRLSIATPLNTFLNVPSSAKCALEPEGQHRSPPPHPRNRSRRDTPQFIVFIPISPPLPPFTAPPDLFSIMLLRTVAISELQSMTPQARSAVSLLYLLTACRSLATSSPTDKHLLRLTRQGPTTSTDKSCVRSLRW
jgi:hypothetical protein